MDYRGQRLAALVTNTVLWLGLAASIAIGYLSGDIRAAVKAQAVATALGALACLPNWPIYNRNPIPFKPRDGCQECAES